MYKWCTGKADASGNAGIFVPLLIAALLVLSAVAFLIWWIPTTGLGNINRALPYLLAFILATATLFLAGSAFLLMLAASGHNVPFPGKLRGLLIKIFFPAISLLGSLFRIDRIKIQKAFIEMNNRLVKSMAIKARPDEFLILLPHCLQFQDCSFKVTKDIENCGECGKCEIVELLHLGRRYGIKLFVNTGGTSARKILSEGRPKAVVAVACERDLVSGITDCYPLPAIGISNIRPEGYCVNTHVEMGLVADAVKFFFGERPSTA